MAHGYTMRHQAGSSSQGRQRDLNPQPPYYKYGELPPHGVAWSRFGCMLTPYGPPQNVRWHHNGYTIGTTHHVRQEKSMSQQLYRVIADGEHEDETEQWHREQEARLQRLRVMFPDTQKSN